MNSHKEFHSYIWNDYSLFIPGKQNGIVSTKGWCNEVADLKACCPESLQLHHINNTIRCIIVVFSSWDLGKNSCRCVFHSLRKKQQQLSWNSHKRIGLSSSTCHQSLNPSYILHCCFILFNIGKQENNKLPIMLKQLYFSVTYFDAFSFYR